MTFFTLLVIVNYILSLTMQFFRHLRITSLQFIHVIVGIYLYHEERCLWDTVVVGALNAVNASFYTKNNLVYRYRV